MDPPPPIPPHSSLFSMGYDEEVSNEHKSYSQMRRPHWQDNSQARSRIMQTYVNARKCATISSVKRGVLAISDGRFAARTEVSPLPSCLKHIVVLTTEIF